MLLGALVKFALGEFSLGVVFARSVTGAIETTAALGRWLDLVVGCGASGAVNFNIIVVSD